MEPLTRKQWTAAWSLPALFFLAVGIGAILPRRGSGVPPVASKVNHKWNKDWWLDMPPTQEVKSNMSDYIVSGAGDSAYNGTYINIGANAYSGYTDYQLDASHWLTFWTADNAWVLTDLGVENGGGPNPNEAYTGGTNTSDPTSGTWFVGTGTTPAPTVALVVADTTAPTIDSDTGASVPAAGDKVSVPLIEADSSPVLPATGVTGFTVKVNGVKRTVTVASITNTEGAILGYIVAGAGSSDYNGTYLDAGTTNNGYPVYKLDDDHYLLVAQPPLSENLYWVLVPASDSDTTVAAYREINQPPDPPDASAWVVSDGGGATPVPTVAADTRPASITADLTIANKIYDDDKVAVSYDSITGNVTDSASTTNVMASFGPVAVDNNSTQTRGAAKRPIVLENGQLKQLPEGEEINATAGNADSGAAVNAIVTLTDGETVTWEVGNNPIEKAIVILQGNRTLSISGAASGQQGILIVRQDGTGGRTLTLPENSKVVSDGSGSVTLSSAAEAVDALAFLYDGTNYYWTRGLSFS